MKVDIKKFCFEELISDFGWTCWVKHFYKSIINCIIDIRKSVIVGILYKYRKGEDNTRLGNSKV